MKITKEFEISATDPKPVTVFAEFPGARQRHVHRGSRGGGDPPGRRPDRGSTGAPMKKTLRAGPHEISVSLAGYKTYTRTIDVAEDDSFAIPRIELKKE